MQAPPLSAIAAEYRALLDTCTVTAAMRGGVEDEAATKRIRAQAEATVATIVANQARYQSVANVFPNQLPWFVISLLHAMEADLNFGCHLHNGDSLKRRTVNEPAGRPPGQPPFTWEESAKDALYFDRFDRFPAADWKDVAGILYHMEAYNGWGSRLVHGIRTPYLWAGSNQEQPGKYVSDGKWDPNARSEQVGAAVLLKLLITSGAVAIQAAPVSTQGAPTPSSATS